MNKILRVVLVFVLAIMLITCGFPDKADGPDADAKRSAPGQGLPGSWRPFSDDSPWNTPIPVDARIHDNSDAVIGRMASDSRNIRFGNSYIIPLWVVNSDHMPWYQAKAAYPFDIWDPDNDLVTDVAVPIDSTLWGEQTPDGHIIIIDTLYNMSWEMSRFKGIKEGMIDCSTFNVWDLTGKGVGDPNEGARWKARGGRGSGFPNIAGLIRPEEIQAGQIRHALAFTFKTNKKNELYYPAARTDGKHDLEDAPAEGMLFQLDPRLTDKDFDEWGLSASAKVVAHALQQYGMYLCDNGGSMALQLQLLDKNTEVNRAMWDSLAPGLYSSITKIPTDQFRVISTGAPRTGGAANIVTTPLIQPPCGTFEGQREVTMVVNEHWPDATIRYTLDGTEPDASSLIYKGSFVLTASKTIKARAFHPQGKDSHVMRAPIIIK